MTPGSSSCCCCCCRYVATELPLRYRKLVTKKSRCYIIICGLWVAAVITFIAPLLTKPNWSYYRYNANQKMCGLHWEYPLFCIITGLYIPILSGLILVFTALRIRATLRRSVRMTNSRTQLNLFASNPTARQSDKIAGSRRTLNILTFTSVAYFTLWSPYVAVVLIQSFVSSFKPPAALDFTVMWLANFNSAVNVFIYSATNTQFRRQCVLLATRICCSRSSSSKQPESRGMATTSPPVMNVSTVNEQVPAPSDDNVPDDGELFTEPHVELLTVDNCTQDVSVESLASNEDDIIY